MSTLKATTNQPITYPDDNRLRYTVTFKSLHNVKKEDKIALQGLVAKLNPQRSCGKR